MEDLWFTSAKSEGSSSLLQGILGGGSSESPFAAMMVNGKTGIVEWSKEYQEISGPWGVAIGNINGEGNAFVALEYEFTTTLLTPLTGEYSFQTHWTGIRLSDGAVLWNETLADQLFFPLPMGDSDGDGIDEFYAISFDFQNQNANAEFQARSFADGVLWSIPISEVSIGLVDLTGNEVLDAILLSSSAQAFGSDGTRLWDYPGMVTATRDWTGDGGADIVGTKFQGAGEESGLIEGSIEMLRGSDGATLWSKKVFSASDYTEAIWAKEPMAWASFDGDVDGDGLADPIVDLYDGHYYFFTCDENSCGQEEKPDMPELDASILLNGDGKTLLRFDNMPLQPAEKNGSDEFLASDEEAVFSEEGLELQSQNSQRSPGLPFFALLSLLAILVSRRR